MLAKMHAFITDLSWLGVQAISKADIWYSQCCHVGEVCGLSRGAHKPISQLLSTAEIVHGDSPAYDVVRMLLLDPDARSVIENTKHAAQNVTKCAWRKAKTITA